MDLTRYASTRYTGKFYFGSKKSDANLVLDTDSDWMFVESAECDVC